MFHIRTTKTSSGAIAIQVIKYKNRKRVVMAHMGSAHSKTEIVSLKQTACCKNLICSTNLLKSGLIRRYFFTKIF